MSIQSVHRRLAAGLLVAGVAVALAGCGGADQRSGPTCDRPDATFDKPTTRLTLRAPGADAEQVDRSRRILCERLAGFGIAHRVQVASTTLTVEVPSVSGLADPSGSAGFFGVGRVAIYDWEANVIGPSGRPAPADPEVTGGPDAGRGAALSLYDAVRRAAQRPAEVDGDNSRRGSRFYAVDPRSGEVFATKGSEQAGAATRAAAVAAVPDAVRDRARVHDVKPGTIVVRAEGVRSGAGSWYVLRDDAAVEKAQIIDPQQRHAEGPGATGEPVVTFDLAPEGQASWQRMTRELADRGTRVGPTQTHGVAGAYQHFAIVIDDAIRAVPFIDFRANPDGIDGRHGSQIEGGLTIASARQLASLLASAPLPVELLRAG